MNEYVGIPYKLGGESLEGCDCWGLLRMVYADKFKVDLPDWNRPDHWAASLKEFSTFFKNPNIIEVQEPKDFDVILARKKAQPWHVGIFLGGHVLHAERGTGSQFVDIFRFRQFYSNPDLPLEYYRWVR